MQHGVGKGLHDVDMFVKSWIQLFCGQNALIVPLWCASEQRISNKTRMTATFTSYKVNVNLHSIRDLFKMTFKKRNQNKWLWQKMIGKIPKWSKLFPLSDKKVTENIDTQNWCPQITFVDKISSNWAVCHEIHNPHCGFHNHAMAPLKMTAVKTFSYLKRVGQMYFMKYFR